MSFLFGLCAKFVVCSGDSDIVCIGGVAYWAGRAAARPLFAANGQAMMFALHFLPY